jgi:hypothetical protein
MAVVQKHMSPKMDLAGDGRIDWFFLQWVYGTEVPRYKFDYTLAPEANGMRLKASLTQSGGQPAGALRVSQTQRQCHIREHRHAAAAKREEGICQRLL